MENKPNSSKKRQKSVLNGAKDGVPFSATNQPSPESKREGWKEFRKKRMLTQELIKMMIGDDGLPNQTFKGYLQSLVKNAKLGNAKAIEAINKCLEDDITKIELSGEVGQRQLMNIDPLILDADNQLDESEDNTEDESNKTN
jgi:hypothetical protein